MDSTRQQKIARLIQKDLGEIFTIEAKGYLENSLVTITKVTVTSDLSIARIYISIFGNAKKDVVLNNIKQHQKELRFSLGNRVKNQLRVVPSLEFYIDDTLDYIENIEKLLRK